MSFDIFRIEKIVSDMEDNGKSNLSVIRRINAYFRKHDESHLYPICGRFNATERAIRRVRLFMRFNGSMGGYEYIQCLDNAISEIVNDPRFS